MHTRIGESMGESLEYRQNKNKTNLFNVNRMEITKFGRRDNGVREKCGELKFRRWKKLHWTNAESLRKRFSEVCRMQNATKLIR